MNPEYDYLFKIVLVGDSAVGKSSIVKRYEEELFISSNLPTIGVDFCIKTIQVDLNAVKLQIWDTAGQERFRTITQSYYRSADAIVLVYDVASADSFRSLPEWLEDIERYAGKTVYRVLIGNKTDRLDRVVDTKTGEDFAKQNGMPFMETSAKNSNNIDLLFSQLAKVLRDLHAEQKLKNPYYSAAGSRTNTVTLSRTTKSEKGGGSRGRICCT